MRIQHNILAMNAYRNYNTNTSALSKNLEKLSSGYKINRAGDDAAGLAISEKMRAQITGLNAAQKNVKDGISLVKTAEGAMQEIQDMLNRMDYLATQSANGTYDDDVDRANLQKELDALKTEINRIADSANFNGIKLLDGSQDGSAAPTAGAVDIDFTNMSGFTKVADGTNERKPAKGKYEVDLSRANFTASTKSAAVAVTIAGIRVDVTQTQTGASITGADIAKKFMDGIKANNNTVTINGKQFKVTHDGSGKLTFNGVDNTEMKRGTNPTKLMVTVKGTDIQKAAAQSNAAVSGSTITVTSGNQGWSMAFTQIEEPVNAANTLAAQAKFDLTSAAIQDGYTIKIGDETYTFAVGKDSAFKDKAGIIDMTDYEAGDTDIEKVAAMRLTGAANGNKAAYVEADFTSGTVYITEKLGGMDRDKWDMIGPRDKQEIDATWEDEDQNLFVQYGTAKADDLPDADGSSKASGGLTLQIGDTSDDFNQLNVIIGNMHVDSLGIAGVDISDQTGAQSAIQKIRDAINKVSSVRGDLGATQNRLEHTANNLSVMAENIQDAESTIRDTDIAEEMMSYTKNNILVQSAQAMLAQANAVPQGVLQLLG